MHTACCKLQAALQIFLVARREKKNRNLRTPSRCEKYMQDCLQFAACDVHQQSFFRQLSELIWYRCNSRLLKHSRIKFQTIGPAILRFWRICRDDFAFLPSHRVAQVLDDEMANIASHVVSDYRQQVVILDFFFDVMSYFRELSSYSLLGEKS